MSGGSRIAQERRAAVVAKVPSETGIAGSQMTARCKWYGATESSTDILSLIRDSYHTFICARSNRNPFQCGKQLVA